MPIGGSAAGLAQGQAFCASCGSRTCVAVAAPLLRRFAALRAPVRHVGPRSLASSRHRACAPAASRAQSPRPCSWAAPASLAVPGPGLG